jgi:hypothetical protein
MLSAERVRRLLTLTFLCLFMTAWLRGQLELGTISGGISDGTGGKVRGAEITVSNADSGFEFKTVTNDQGQFVAPNLIAGRYRLVVFHSGFKTVQREDLFVRSNDRLVVNLTLEVGDLEQKVDVRGDLAPLLQKESATIKTTLDSDQVTELPTKGRTVFDLARLVAGATSGTPGSNDNSTTIPDNGRAAQGLSVNAQGGVSGAAINTYILDGVNNNNAAGTSGYMAILPPLEAIEEFSIETSNSTPEVARGGGLVSMILKSGTNRIHGSVFEFLRNSDLDARNFFDLTKPTFEQNQFGPTLGGPVRKNRTFFFIDYQGFRQRQGQTLTSTLPGAQIRAGNFGGLSPIYDPATYDAATNTRQLFPGNSIPANRFSPAAAAILKYLPLPNDPSSRILSQGQGLYYAAPSVQRNQDSFDVKINHQNGKNSFAARYSYGRADTLLPGAFSNNPAFSPAVGGSVAVGAGAGYLTGTVSNPAQNAGLQWIRDFSPTTLNELRAAVLYAGANARQLGWGRNYASQLGIPNANASDLNSGFPGISISGLGAIGESVAYPLINIENGYQILDNVTLIRGTHTLKAGIDIRYVRETFTQLLGSPAGSFSFGQDFTANPAQLATTGNAFASFLLGIPDSGSLVRLQGPAGLRWWEDSGYVQDTWKITPRLAMTYGLRYEVLTPSTEAHGRITNFDLGSGKLLLPGENGSRPGYSNPGLVATDYKHVYPRVGLAYQLNSRTVLRASFGLFSLYNVGKYSANSTLNPPFTGGYNYTNSAVPQQIVRTLDQGFPVTNPFVPIDQPTGGLYAIDPAGKKGYNEQYSVSLQRQIFSNLSWDLSYVGNSAHNLYDRWNVDQAALGTGPSQAREPYYGTAPNVTSILLSQGRGYANYNALQTTLTKRFSAGFSLLANYTWSHSLSSVASQQQSLLTYANAPVNAPQRFVMSWLYELPYGRDRSAGGNAVLRGVAGGWRIGGILEFQSGLPYTVAGGASLPNRLCNGSVPNPTVQEWFNPGCFAIPAQVADPVHGGQYIPFGNSGYYILSSDGVRDVDFSATKFFDGIREGHRIQLRIEAYNAVNNAQFYAPNATLQTGLQGIVLSARPSRQLQIALKYSF